MSKYKFGDRSQSNLNTAHSLLIAIAERALGYGVIDFSVIDGHRTIASQKALFDVGKSTKDGVNNKSKHNYMPSLAVDVLPYPSVVNGVKNWDDSQRFCVLAGLMFAAAKEIRIDKHGYSLRWGGDWDGDGNNADSKLNDYPHFELVAI